MTNNIPLLYVDVIIYAHPYTYTDFENLLEEMWMNRKYFALRSLAEWRNNVSR